MLDDIRKQYDEVQYALEQLAEQTTHEERSIERGQFEDRYCAALAKINDIIDMKNAPAPPINTAPSVVGNQQNNASNNGFSQLNLPVLNLKTYDGSYKEWLNFENSFKSVIGENKNLNNCQRLQYLRSVLRNEALRQSRLYLTRRAVVNLATLEVVIPKRFSHDVFCLLLWSFSMNLNQSTVQIIINLVFNY
jgi:hypothetical protein